MKNAKSFLLKKQIEETPNISPEKRKELLDRTEALQKELQSLHTTHEDYANNIAGLAKKVTSDTLDKKNATVEPHLTSKILSEYIRRFETSHPKLTSAINSFCHTLSNLGI